MWDIGIGLHPTLPHVESDPSLGTDPGGGQRTLQAGSSPGRRGDRNVPHPLAGTLLQVGGLWGRILLVFASTCCSQLCRQPFFPSLSASQHPACPRPRQDQPGGSRGASSPPHRQPSSQASCLLLLLSPPGHLEAGRRTIARRMSKMVPIALATHSRAAGVRGVRQLPEKRILPRRRGLPCYLHRQPPPWAPRPTSHAGTGSAT